MTSIVKLLEEAKKNNEIAGKPLVMEARLKIKKVFDVKETQFGQQQSVSVTDGTMECYANISGHPEIPKDAAGKEIFLASTLSTKYGRNGVTVDTYKGKDGSQKIAIKVTKSAHIEIGGVNVKEAQGTEQGIKDSSVAEAATGLAGNKSVGGSGTADKTFGRQVRASGSADKGAPGTERAKTRSIVLAYAKDLVIEDKIPYDKMFIQAEEMFGWITDDVPSVEAQDVREALAQQMAEEGVDVADEVVSNSDGEEIPF